MQKNKLIPQINNEWYEKDFTHKYSHASWSRVLFVSVSDAVFGLDSPVTADKDLR